MGRAKAKRVLRVAVDTREQLPWSWPVDEDAKDVFETERRKLDSGDYTLIGDDGELLDHLMVIERKSLEDFVGCVGRERERFERELERLCTGTLWPFVFVEGSYGDIANRCYPGRLYPQQIVGSIYGWSMDYGVHIHCVSSRAIAMAAARLLFRRVDRYLQDGRLVPSKGQCGISNRTLTLKTR